MGEPALSLVSQNTNHADVNELLSLASEVILDKEREIMSGLLIGKRLLTNRGPAWDG